MKFGLLLFGGLPGQSLEQTLQEAVEKAQIAKESGFHAVWTSGGHLGKGLQGTLLQAHITAYTGDMELGVLYLLPLEHPILLAEEISTLDLMCGGRLTVSIALGWRDFQFEAFGIPSRQRLPRFLETLEAMKQLWTRDEVDFQGRYIQVKVERPIPKPVQQPYPRLLVAANVDPGIQRAASIADGWLISSRSTYPTIEHQVGLYKEALRQANRKGTIWAWREAYVAQDKQTAMDTIRPSVEAMYADRASLGHARDLPVADRINVPFEQILENRFIIGDPDQCTHEIRRYQELGVETIIMRMQWPGMPQEQALSSIRLMGQEVLPRFASL
jgi:alkanesulfonate monooxygenase SsuD/methylene tetrahydromethanopterin reductase-like flavin-dependent oxidoreductase (luciferase family)